MDILAVDDSPLILEFLGEVLREAGHSVTSTGSAKDGLDVLDRQSFDLIISDVHMPDIDGFALTRAIRSDVRHMATPVVLLTADQSARFGEDCRNAGVTGWIRKPVAPHDLLRQVERFAL